MARRTIKAKMQALFIVLVFVTIYYGFLMDFLVIAKDSMVNVMQSHNLTSIEVNVKEYNGTSWIDKPKVIDLTGLFDTILTLIIIFAPVIVIAKWIIW